MSGGLWRNRSAESGVSRKLCSKAWGNRPDVRRPRSGVPNGTGAKREPDRAKHQANGGPDANQKERTMRLRKQILCVVLVSLFGLTGLGTAQVDDAPSLAGVIDIHA